jgi:hypothetical protein
MFVKYASKRLARPGLHDGFGRYPEGLEGRMRGIVDRLNYFQLR